jgi:hypothetical protein
VDKLAILFGPPCDCPGSIDCPCPPPRREAAQEIDFIEGHGDAGEVKDVPCFAGAAWPGLYCGVFDTRLGSLADGHRGSEFELRFPGGPRCVERMFLLCRYRVRPASPGCHR